eukprot:206057-Pleurochrysis_carterae.AAC.1
MALPIQPIRHPAGDTDTEESSSPNDEGVSAQSPTATAMAAVRAAMVAEFDLRILHPSIPLCVLFIRLDMG